MPIIPPPRGSDAPLLAAAAVMALTLTITAVTAIALVGGGATRPDQPTAPTLTCPLGYHSREVRLEHQRLEHDPSPPLSPVVVPNTWPEDMPPGSPPDRRYTIALACVRPLTTSERAAEPYTDHTTTEEPSTP